MIRVFHVEPFGAITGFDISTGQEVIDAIRRGHALYNHVANVHGIDDLERAFRLTNTIDNYWWENNDVTRKFDGDGCRSTSTGDLLLAGDGHVYAVAPCGFKRLPDETTAYIHEKP